MESIERLKLEVRAHRKVIDETVKAMNHEKSEMRKVLKKIEEDKDGENDSMNYGLINAYSDKICRYLKSKKELSELILIKIESISKYS